MDFFPAGHPLLKALTERDYTDPTAVQEAVLEPGAAGRDLLVSAQTGSGKTVAYGLAIADTLLGDSFVLEPAAEPLALIVAPTRELALQVHRELTWLYEHAGARVVSCVGGMDPRAEQRMLGQGAHIVVGTPGRLRDHLERGGLRINRLKAVVLDEADEMLDLGFREDLEFILEATPQERRTLLFSATLPHGIVSMAKRYQRNAWRIAVSAGTQGHADIEYRAVRVAPNEIEHAVVNLLRYFESPTAMVFCNTRDSVRHLQAILLERGFAAVALSGELGQNERNNALQALRDGRARVCVATDVAARGIDLPNLGLVIHAELPQNAQTLQHRSGRTGRAGKKGVSVLLVQLSRRRKADMLLQTAGLQAIWSGAPSAEDIRKLDQERLLTSPLLTEETTEDDLAMAKALLAERPAEEIAAALVRMYRSHLPAAEEVFDPGPGSPSREPREHREREPRPPREGKGPGLPGGAVWFRMNIGRQKNADPRWLIPMICRQGKITKAEIGAIRIFERETRFEIDAATADRFATALRQIEKAEVRIERLAEHASEPAAGPVPAGVKPIGPKTGGPKKAPWKDKKDGPRKGKPERA
ncbi:superfamily II DNA/RNA helicase [Paramagnetospirillum caucaseum]|uniref:Superfamily II DNA/RNA helicase n=1 Tax=Paramagnetospirillum caucaseum TaxID=1244869 RepID=M2ZTI8_9PROT|nr:DEAD/DEAH box helicase [Paramagnetospirillum caucaseum]EME70687.1 superfamily II DNA/RNA helicase [Paramagnetospirillum caucaseum]